ncbi:MAG: DUF433 domain-containing protein [Planctomycetes bacterium]|nr:DUF433 domain-containing protein [Planctomycetota bacterium]
MGRRGSSRADARGEVRDSIEPDRRGWKPCIRGLRIAVIDVLDQPASGMSGVEVLAERAQDVFAQPFALDSRSPISVLASTSGLAVSMRDRAVGRDRRPLRGRSARGGCSAGSRRSVPARRARSPR